MHRTPSVLFAFAVFAVPSTAFAEASCLEILENNPSSASGAYTIDDGVGGTVDVYCDMETDGGGWTRFLRMTNTNGFIAGDNHLAGGNTSGTSNTDLTSSTAFVLPFTDYGFDSSDHMLFATGDYVTWGVLGIADVNTLNTSLDALNAYVLASYGAAVAADEYTNVLYRNPGSVGEDPWIGFEGRHWDNAGGGVSPGNPTSNKMMYGENGFFSTVNQHHTYKNAHLGINVFVREAEADLCIGDDNEGDADGDGFCADVDADDSVDTDGDGVVDALDNCPDDANADQADLDGDGEGDVCDSDADGDGDPATTDCDDLDPTRYTDAVEVCDDGIDNDCDDLVDTDDVDDVDLDDPASDCDDDGFIYSDDNCVNDANPGQDDLDLDGDGDVCDDDDDGDGVDDGADNCPVDANADQVDADGDGAGDVCDNDVDGDGVGNGDDFCDGTVADAPTKGLGQNRWADVDGDGEFDTKGKNPTGRYFEMIDTAGCSCDQIIDECGYGQGHSKFGCSNSVMDTWTGLYDEAGGDLGVCKDD